MKKFLTLLIAVALLSSFSFAQSSFANIKGKCELEDGAAIPGVKVTLTGDVHPTLTTTTSENGNFLFRRIAPGTIALKFELEGFQTLLMKGIKLSIGKDEDINVQMKTGTITEQITVLGQAGAINTRKTQVGVTIDKDWVSTIPTARNPWTVLSAIPGIMIDRVDVGGADSGQQSNFMAGGGDADDTTWFIDGANITDPSAIGAAPAYMNINSYDELQVTLGANDITAQTGGIQLNFVSKRAGNRTTGDFHLYVEDEKWEMSQTKPDDMGADLVIPGMQRLNMYGVNIGGPVIKDKLWWFGSWAIQDIHKRTEANNEDATWLVSGYGKLNFQLGNTSGDFHISYDAKLKWGRTWLSPSQQDAWSLWDQTGPGYLYYGSLSHVFGELMLNVKTIYTDGGFALDPRGSDRDPVTGHSEGREFRMFIDTSPSAGLGFYTDGSAWDYSTNRNTINIALDGNYFLEGALGGDHEIRFGVDYYTGDTTTQSMTPNQRISYIYRYGDGPADYYPWLRIQTDYILDVSFKRISAYISDTINFGKLTATIGLRYDKETGSINPFTQPYFTWYEPGSPHNGERMFASQIAAGDTSGRDADAAWDLISPRLSLTYDINGDGKSVVKFTAGRYMGQSGNNLAGNYVPYRYGYAYWNDANMDYLPQYAEVGALYNDTEFGKMDVSTGLLRVEYADDYNSPILYEATLSFEQELFTDLVASVTGFWKKKTKLAIGPDDEGEYGQYAKGILPGGGIETAGNWYMAGNEEVGGTTVPTYDQTIVPIGDYYYNLANSYTQYYGVQLKLTKRLSNKWMANLSFTWNDWKWHFDEADMNGDLNNFDFFDGGVVAESTTGSGLSDLWVNSTWIVKFSGMYQLPYGINLTGFFQAREGNPQPLRRQVTGFVGGSLYFYRDGMKSGDERLPTLWMLNVGLEKTFKISDTASATLVIDWYNATNNQIVLKHSLSIGTDAPDPPTPSMWMNAGLFQFGVRVNF